MGWNVMHNEDLHLMGWHKIKSKTKQSLCNVPMFCTQKLESSHHVSTTCLMVFNDIWSEIPKFLCVFQIVPNSTTFYPISFGQTSTFVDHIARPKEKLN